MCLYLSYMSFPVSVIVYVLKHFMCDCMSYYVSFLYRLNL